MAGSGETGAIFQERGGAVVWVMDELEVRGKMWLMAGDLGGEVVDELQRGEGQRGASVALWLRQTIAGLTARGRRRT